ncbi:MAG TPA: hypothetical protein V6D17_24375 [Candidatus Obscuribacterales bacterium]
MNRYLPDRRKTPYSMASSFREGRSEKGASSFIEVSLGSFLLIMVILLSVDAYVWMHAYMINDMACRDACRSAAEGVPATGATTKAAYQQAAREAALAQLKLHISNGPYIANPQLVSLIWNDYNNTLPRAPETPYVSVTTSIDVKMPAPVFFMGAQVMWGGANKALTLKRTYVFPIVHLRPV